MQAGVLAESHSEVMENRTRADAEAAAAEATALHHQRLHDRLTARVACAREARP